jgi:hypothetical protein
MTGGQEIPIPVLPDVDEFISVNRDLLYRTLNFLQARAIQNHKLHQDWNEGAGDFVACTRGDCTEVKALLNEWGLGY